MAVAYKIYTARTIAEAVSRASKFSTSWANDNPPYLWFRGVKNTSHALQPGGSRRRRYQELGPLVEFVQGGVAFGEVGGLDEWDTYYLAQHHGIPTRLLDWTESFMAALFFAFDEWNGRTTPAVYALQPCGLNGLFLGWRGILGPERHGETRIWLPKEIARKTPLVVQDQDGYAYDNEWPLALYPKWSNDRITTQQGMFTIHGRKCDPLDTLIAECGGDPRDYIAKIELVDFDRRAVRNELASLGVRRSAIYPDLDNFVKELMGRGDW